MKKIIMLAVVLTTLATSAFSKPSVNIGKQVLNAFSRNYNNAQDVKWEMVGTYMKATFTIDGQQMFAYYRENGEQFAATRNITPAQLPISLGNELKSKINDQWLTELFEISADEETTYFATCYNADMITVYKADASGSWKVFKKTKRPE